MKREIKFRVFDKVDNSMSAPDWDANKWEHFSPGRYITMQYTGLLDCHGKEIFEGDIVLDIYDDKEYAVEWSQWELYNGHGFYCWGTGKKAFGCDKNKNVVEGIEVIGNIYEHGDLLK